MTYSIYLILFGCIITINAYAITKNAKNTGHTICQTDGCRKIAQTILRGMNKTVSPCNDFYSYTCGSWQKNYPKSEGVYEGPNLYTVTQEKIINSLKEIVQKPPKPDDNKVLSLQKAWYSSCINTNKINNEGLISLANTIESFGGWPIAMNIRQWFGKGIYWTDVAQLYTKIIGSHPFYYFDLSLVNSSHYVPTFTKPVSDSNDEITLTGSKIPYLRYIMLKVIENYASITGQPLYNVENNINQLIDFQKKLIQIRDRRDSDNVKHERKLSITKLSDFKEKDTWYEMFKFSYEESGLNTKPFLPEELNVESPDYFNKLTDLLKNTSFETIVNYIFWKLVIYTMPYLDQSTFDLYTTISDNGLENIKKLERSDLCFKKMPFYKVGVLLEFYKTHFSEETKGMISNIIEEVQRELVTNITNSKWMSKEIKQLIKEKLNEMKLEIGYQNYLYLTIYNNKVYENLTFGDNYFHNFITVSKFYSQHLEENIKNRIQEYKIFNMLLAHPAFYSDPKNSLLIPEGGLIPPIFDLEAPAALKYGSVGHGIASGIFHVLNAHGQLYSKNGTFRSRWWPIEMEYEYKEKVKCFAKRLVKKQIHKKILSDEDHVADTVGLSVAFRAYKNAVDNKNNTFSKLPGLQELDEDQLFFVSFARTMCDSRTVNYLKNERPIYSFRVNEAVGHLDEFYQAFHCTNNSLIYKKEHCNFFN